MDRPDLVVRPATRADVTKFYPDSTCSFKAWVADLDGEAVGIVGIALARPFASMFSAFDEKLRPHLRHPAVLRAIKKAHLAVEETKLPVLAIAEPTEATAPGLLQRLGFVPFEDSVDGEVYRWRKH